MIPAGRIPCLRTGIPALLLAFLCLSCGSGGLDFAGGGTGGTGISTGTISGFGSVVVNGVHFRTDDNVAPGFVTKKTFNGMDNTSKKDRDLFRVGMVVTVLHAPDDNNALEIVYRDNLLGPVAEKVAGTDNVIVVLGQAVVVNDAAVFAALTRNEIVAVSGFADDAGRLRADHVSRASRPADGFEVRGFVSGLSGNTFRLGPLPDGSGATGAVFYGAAALPDLPGGPVNGMYVLVATPDREPAGGVITAARITKLAARTDFPENAAVGLEGLVTAPPGGSGKVLTFAVEGKRVRTGDATDFTGHSPAEIRSNARLQVQGTETGGTLSAARIVFR